MESFEANDSTPSLIMSCHLVTRIVLIFNKMKRNKKSKSNYKEEDSCNNVKEHPLEVIVLILMR